MKRVAILLSGRGSNFLALSDAVERGEVPAKIVLVISNREEAPGLEAARERGYKALFVPSKGKKREDFDREVVNELNNERVDVVCLAGFMRLLSSFFVRQFPERILNIHPSLLPAFPGLDAQKQALNWGAKVSGCTVHFVDEELDHGAIIVQRAVAVQEGDDEDAIAHRILEEEHRIYPEALALVCQDRVRVEGRRARIFSPKD